MSRDTDPTRDPDPPGDAQHFEALLAREGGEFLVDAIQRNVPIELFRSEQLGKMPAAKARLLNIDAEAIIVDEVKTIGRAVNLANRQSVEVFFQYSNAIFHFSSVVLEASCNVRLNARKIVPGMRLAFPKRVAPGQRRNAYRVSFALAAEPVRVDVYRAPFTADLPMPDLNSPPLRSGTIADASDGGMSIIIPGSGAPALKHFDCVFVRLHLPAADQPVVLLTEVRKIVEIQDRQSYKYGLLLLPWPTPREMRTAMAPLLAAMRELQRAELSRRAG